MELSVALNTPLTETMRATTNRQFAAWRAWLFERWNRPDRGDHYAMQVAAEVRRGRVKDAKAVKDEDFILKFVAKDAGAETKPPATPEEAARRSKGVWGAVLRDSPVVKTEPGGDR